MQLKLDNVNVSYGAIEAVRGVTLVANPGDITCVMGRNGVGKTTLMRAVMGLLKTQSGTMIIGETDITRHPPHRRAKGGVALVPQGRQIFPKLTVTDNLRVGLQARTDGSKTIPPVIYEMFPVLKDMGHRRGGDLSGGQQQQLAIGRALAGDPKVLLLDEPTEGIQPNIIDHIGHVLTRLKDEWGMTILLVEQYLGFVREFGQQYHIMNRGQVVASGTTDTLTDALIAEHLSV